MPLLSGTLPDASNPSRRRVLKSGLTAGLGLGAIGLLGTACSATVSTAADASSTTSSGSVGPWSFTLLYVSNPKVYPDLSYFEQFGVSFVTWAVLPAVKADQIVAWNSEPRYSYSATAPIVHGFGTALQNAKKVA